MPSSGFYIHAWTHIPAYTGAHTPYNTLTHSNTLTHYLYGGKFTIILPDIYEHTLYFKYGFSNILIKLTGAVLLHLCV